MMSFSTLSAERADGHLLRLIDILALIPENTLQWSILEYDGVGGLGIHDLSLEQISLQARKMRLGYLLNFSDLKKFAETLFQTFDCLIVASHNIEDFYADRSDITHFTHAEYVIEAFDGYEWTIGTHKPLDFSALL